ncbi:Hypothetical protein BJL86_3238 [Dietzia timorensis]|uniref:Uncharacterized protein n=1 Tax=Dietzia timorensis TaxID=499555 RepID=A0A173LR63_9ACTN|nr:Hypothetical protein BJL86_3238 [Dietzia timorensis]
MANLVWFPFIPRPSMRMKETVGIAEDLKIDPTKARIRLTTHALNGLAEEIHIVEKRKPGEAFQVGKSFDPRSIGEQHAIPGKKLNVSDRCETGGKAGQDCGVRAVDGAAHSIRLPSI